MKSTLMIMAACAAIGLAPGQARAADLDYPVYGYEDDGGYDDSETVVVRRGPTRYVERDAVEVYVDEPDYAYRPRYYGRPYLRAYNWYDRPRYGQRRHWRHARHDHHRHWNRRYDRRW